MKESVYRERLDSPDDGVQVWSVFTAARSGLELGRVCIHWHGNDDLDVVGCRPPLELTLGLQQQKR